MRIVGYLAILLVSGILNANAQTFATDSGIKDTAKDEGEAPAATAPAMAPEEDAGNYKVISRQNEFIKNSEVNIGDTQKRNPNDKLYDNSVGRIIQYKIVDGKIVFEDNDDRKVLVYYEDYKVEKGMDNLVRCSMRIYVLNDMTERINNLSFKLIWPDINTSIQMSRINPGVRTYQDIMLLGNGCFSMDKTPTIEINRCRVKGKTEEKCADAVKWFKYGK